jgi:hypothetical protein
MTVWRSPRRTKTAVRAPRRCRRPGTRQTRHRHPGAVKRRRAAEKTGRPRRGKRAPCGGAGAGTAPEAPGPKTWRPRKNRVGPCPRSSKQAPPNQRKESRITPISTSPPAGRDRDWTLRADVASKPIPENGDNTGAFGQAVEKREGDLGNNPRRMQSIKRPPRP